MGIEPLVLTIPGVSLATGPRRRRGMGERFRSAAALVSYAGLNSSVSQSGSSTRGRPHNQARRPVPPAGGGWRRTAPASTTRRQGLHDKKRAEASAIESPSRRLRGSSATSYAVMRDQVPYDPEPLGCLENLLACRPSLRPCFRMPASIRYSAVKVRVPRFL